MSNISGSENQKYPAGLMIAAGLMILFGLAEIVTGLRHSFFGLITSQGNISTILGIALGLFYLICGLLLLTQRRWAAELAIVLLCADVIGRIVMVLTGLYPVNSFQQTFAIVVGTLIAAFFAVYIRLSWKYFR